MLKVYMAGKITKNCQRHDIVDGLRYHEYYEDNIVFDKKFIYVGPYFIGCYHGCYHGNSSHGRGNFDNDINGCIQDASMYSSQDIVNLCFCGINESDVVFCYLDSNTAYGTLVELGHAYTMGKVIYIACNDKKVKNLKL